MENRGVFTKTAYALRNGALRIRTAAPAIGCALVLVAPSHAQQDPILEQWSLAKLPVAVVGSGDGVQLENVTDAAVMADGTVLLADARPRRILRVSPVGEVVAVLGGRGEGPGEFGWLQRVFALGDTIVAYDSQRARTTIWRPGADEPDIRPLVQVDGAPTRLLAVVSSDVWVVEANSYASLDAKSGLTERRREVMLFDVAGQRTESLGMRRLGYDHMLRIEGGVVSYSMAFLGGAQVAAAGGAAVVVPIGEAVLEVWRFGVDGPERRVALPVGRPRYSREAIRALRAEALSQAVGEDVALIRRQFDDTLDDLPPLAPPVRRVVAMGRDVWLQPFSPDLEGGRDWLVVDPVVGAVRATVAVPQDFRLLGGSDDAAVLLGETAELEEQFVQVRRVERTPVR